MLKKFLSYLTFANLAKFIGKITFFEVVFWGTPGFCILRGKRFKSLFAVYFFNSRIFFQVLYLPEISIKIDKKYAIDIINLVGFIPISYIYYLHQNDETIKYVFFGYLTYMLILFFFTDAKEKEPIKKHKLIEKGQ